MAHFSVMVVGKNIQQQMHKYDENNLEEKVFKKEMSYRDMKELFDEKSERESTYVKTTIENFAYDIYRWIYDADTNSFGIFINPHAKFDNKRLGGRFSFNLNIKGYDKGTYIALKNQIDMERMENEAKQKAIEFKDFFTHKMSFTEEDMFKTFGTDQENIDRSICEYCCPSYIFNGIWHEQGSDTHSEWLTKFRTFFKNLDGDELITLVDCHK